jgi:aromatic ring-opening dioxygenase catalytic subunit (LigB family)
MSGSLKRCATQRVRREATNYCIGKPRLPHAEAHPQEDHLIPLMVAVGAAEQEKGERVYHEDAFMGGTSVSSYRFG